MIDDANFEFHTETNSKSKPNKTARRRRGYNKSICGRHGRLYTFDEV